VHTTLFALVGKLLPKVDVLQLDAEIVATNQRDRLLQIVTVLAGDAQLRFLNRSLHLQLRSFDFQDDLLGNVGFDAFFRFYLNAPTPLPRGHGLASLKEAQADLPANQLFLQHFPSSLGAVFARRCEHNGFLRTFNFGTRVLEVKALQNFFLRLPQSVFHFVPLQLRNNIETRRNCAAEARFRVRFHARMTSSFPNASNLHALPRLRTERALRELGGIRVSTRTTDRLHTARDLWPRHHLGVRSGEPTLAGYPDAVIYPESQAQVQSLVRLARQHGIALTPYGAGSGVTGGVSLHDERPHWIVDLKKMDRLNRIDRERQLIDVMPGMMGLPLEAALAEQGLTLGHFPSSILCSTVGGWIAARGAGQCSSRYGKIEDMVHSLDVVLGTGEHIRATSHDGLADMFVGSEGALGILTNAELRVAKTPSGRGFAAFDFDSTEAGLIGLRRLMQAGFRPAVARLYDPFDAMLAKRGKTSGERQTKHAALASDHAKKVHALLPGLKPSWARWLFSSPRLLAGVVHRLERELFGPALLVLIFEETECTGRGAVRAHQEVQAARILLEQHGGRYAGEAPARTWLLHRYSVSYRQAPVFGTGLFSDTFEIAAPWDRLESAYHAIRDAVSKHCFVMAHMSHAYPDGCCIYFSFVGGGLDPASPNWEAESRARYDAAWKAGLDAAEKSGATVAHHHGVGRSKAATFASEVSDGGMGILSAIKRVCDPDGIMNPGCLGLAPNAARLEASATGDNATSDNAGDNETRKHHQAKREPETKHPVSAIDGPHSNVGTDGYAIDHASLLLETRPTTSCDTLIQAAARAGLTLRLQVPKSDTLILDVLREPLRPRDENLRVDPVASLIAGFEGFTARGERVYVRPTPRRSAGPDLARVALELRGVHEISRVWLCLERTAARSSPRLPYRDEFVTTDASEKQLMRELKAAVREI
jgi:alkyldihydroxyacetonephosphate synthase